MSRNKINLKAFKGLFMKKIILLIAVAVSVVIFEYYVANIYVSSISDETLRSQLWNFYFSTNIAITLFSVTLVIIFKRIFALEKWAEAQLNINKQIINILKESPLILDTKVEKEIFDN